ncbi:MAG: hypothetical protein O3C40_20315 [Planctomycetota bacterium]|nr:hypothetical protein [Planctomycetota bacterium]
MISRPSLLLTLIWLSGLVDGRALLAQDFSTVTISLVSASSVSDRFQREMETATRSVPPQVWNTLDEAGWRIQLAEFVVDAAPSLRGVRPNGWPRHLTWDNSDAIHLPAAKLLVLAEKRRDRAGEIVASSRVAGVLRHEIGHAFDMAAGRRSQNLSASQHFLHAYQQDVSRIALADRNALAYYLQDSRNGLQETFAEAFAVALGGGSSDIQAVAFETHFPRVMAYARKSISEPVASSVVTAPSPVETRTTVRRRLIRRR